MKLALAVFLSLLVAGPASALSCVMVSVQQAFANAHDSDEAFLPVLGSFSGFAPRPSSNSPNPDDRVYKARFTGNVMTSNGKGRALDMAVTVNETCIASWCGILQADLAHLTFLRRDGAGYVFDVHACGGNAFPSPTRSQINTMRACLRNKSC